MLKALPFFFLYFAYSDALQKNNGTLFCLSSDPKPLSLCAFSPVSFPVRLKTSLTHQPH